MLGKALSSALKMRLILSLIQRAAPSKRAVQQRAGCALAGVVAAVAGGMLCALALTALFTIAGFALYQYAQVSALGAIAIVFAGLFLSTLVVVIYARHKVKQAFLTEEKPVRSARSKESPTAIINSFIAGFNDAATPSVSPKADAIHKASTAGSSVPPYIREVK